MESSEKNGQHLTVLNTSFTISSILRMDKLKPKML